MSLDGARFEALFEVIEALCLGDLQARFTCSPDQDDIDAIGYALNVLAEETQHARAELQRAKEEAEAASRASRVALARQCELESLKERLVQMLIHDLKNPLTAATANLEILSMTPPLTPPQLEMVEEALASSSRMQRMTLDILDVLRLEGSTLEVERAPIDLVGLARESLAGLRQQARGANKRLRLAPPRGGIDRRPPEIDARLIRRVLDNLLLNAIKYTPPDTEITLECGLEEDGAVSIGVLDQGAGIPEAQRARVFEVYTRLAGERHARSSQGLGLAFCKLAVEAHGGRIWVEENLPEGAAFRVRLPGPD